MSSNPDLMNQAVELAKSQLQNYKKLAVEETSTDIPAPVCAVNDKDCVKRWVQAFGDCA